MIYAVRPLAVAILAVGAGVALCVMGWAHISASQAFCVAHVFVDLPPRHVPVDDDRSSPLSTELRLADTVWYAEAASYLTSTVAIERGLAATTPWPDGPSCLLDVETVRHSLSATRAGLTRTIQATLSARCPERRTHEVLQAIVDAGIQAHHRHRDEQLSATLKDIDDALEVMDQGDREPQPIRNRGRARYRVLAQRYGDTAKSVPNASCSMDSSPLRAQKPTANNRSGCAPPVGGYTMPTPRSDSVKTRRARQLHAI